MATPETPTVQGMTLTRPSGGVSGIHPTIRDVSSRRQSQGSPAAHPHATLAATGWDEELLDRGAGVQLQRLGHSESPLGRIHPTRPTLLRGRYRLRNRLTGGPESVRYGWPGWDQLSSK